MGKCVKCNDRRAIIKRPKTGEPSCKECFLLAVETEVHELITGTNMFSRGEKVAIGVSGGKGAQRCFMDRCLCSHRLHCRPRCLTLFPDVADSTVLADIMCLLNQRYDYGLELFLLSIDEGIHGYRDDSLEVCLLFSILCTTLLLFEVNLTCLLYFIVFADSEAEPD